MCSKLLKAAALLIVLSYEAIGTTCDGMTEPAVLMLRHEHGCLIGKSFATDGNWGHLEIQPTEVLPFSGEVWLVGIRTLKESP